MPKFATSIGVPLAVAAAAVSTGTLAPSKNHRPTPTLQLPSKTQSRCLYTSLGCWTDSSTRVMPHFYGNINSNMPSACITACYNLGYLYAGCEYTTECYCGDVYSTLGSSTQCTATCSDNVNLCGGGYALSVYSSGVTPSPTPAPTTRAPTSTPTAAPTELPTAAPTTAPTSIPTASPTTAAPSQSPTSSPTSIPSASPTTAAPTAQPSAAPSSAPTFLPTSLPTAAPTSSPTAHPSATPTAVPTCSPAQAPTTKASPTSAPTTLCASLPSVSIEGASTGSLTVYRANELKLFAAASLPGCPLSYAWAESGGLHFASTSADPRYLALAPYTLTAGETYTFAVTVSTALGSSAAVSIAVSVSASNITVAVKGGDATVYTGVAATLDASWTVDSDDASGYCSACVYSFACLTRLGQACRISLLPLTAVSASAVTIPANALTGGITYDFTVIAIRSGSPSSTTVVSLYAVDDQVPTVAVIPVVGPVNANQGIAVVAVTTAASFSAAAASWSLVSGSFAGDLSFDDVRGSVASYSVKAGTTKVTSLVLPADVLVPGTTYTLRLTSAYLSTGATGYAYVSFPVNDAPSGGTFHVFPADGAPLDTFTFNATGWTDQDLPLAYTFAYIAGTNDNAADEVVVRTKRSAETSDVYLPQGSGAAYSIIAVAYIYDVWGASSRVTFAVTVKPRSASAITFSASALSLLGPAKEAGDTDGLFQVVGMLNVALNANNCSAAPNCTEIGRFDCSEGTGSGLCGYCLSGYSGVAGTGNTPCIALSEAPAHCFDGVTNEDETDVDCGGSECQVCDSDNRCANATDCRFGSCESGVCGAQQKGCLDSCNGHGTCAFIDSGGIEIAAGDCSVEMLLCYPTCRCSEGYYGETCQYNATEFDAVLAVRSASIDALASVAVDETQESLGQLASALSQALSNPAEVPSDAMEVGLQVALNFTAASSTLGLLPATGAATAGVIDALMTAALLGEASFSANSLKAVTSNFLQALAVGMEVGQDASAAASAATAFSAIVVEIGGDDVNITAALSLDASALSKTPAQVWIPADAPLLASSAYSSAVVGIASFGLNPRPKSNTTLASNVLRLFLAGHDQSLRRRRRLSGGSCHAGEDPPLSNLCDSSNGACLPGNAIVLSAPSGGTGSVSRAALDIASGSRVAVSEVQNRRAASTSTNTSYVLLTLSNDAMGTYPEGEVEEIQESCGWDEYERMTGSCSDGTPYSVACDGVASNTTISCPANITVQYCTSASGSDNVYASTSCSVASYSSSSTVCKCGFSASLFGFGSTKAGDTSSSLVDDVSEGGLQADFATVFLATPTQFLVMAKYASLLTPELLAQNIIALTLLVALLALAVVAAYCGWRLDHRDRSHATDTAADDGRFAGDACSGKEKQGGSSLSSRLGTEASTGVSSFEAAHVQERPSSRLRVSARGLLMTSSRHRRPKVAAGNREDEDASDEVWSPRHLPQAARGGGLVVDTAIERRRPEAKYLRDRAEVPLHHLGSARFKGRFYLLLKTRHDFFNIYFLFSESFTRPQRVAYFLSTVLSLMALDATVSSYIYGSGAPCLSLHTRSQCLDAASGYGEDTICIWHAKSGSCTYGQASVGLESAAIISTVALIFRLPLDILGFLVFGRFIARPTRRYGLQRVAPESPTASPTRPLMASGHDSSISWPVSPSESVSPATTSSAAPTCSTAVSNAAVAYDSESAIDAKRVSITGLLYHSGFDFDGSAVGAAASSRKSDGKESKVSSHRRNRTTREAELKERVTQELAAFIVGEKRRRRKRGVVNQVKGVFRIGLVGRRNSPTVGGPPLRRKVEMATAAALELEEEMSKLAPAAAEKKLFEVAEAESLSNMERRVFLRTRLVGNDSDPAPVPRWQKLLAWSGLMFYIASMAFYVFLFEAREGERTSRIWATSLAFALLQDIAIFTPLKLCIVFLFVPSLMRHRLHPDMFRNIPRYASSVQVARRRPDLQVSQLVLDGRIPRGSEYAEFIPPATQRGWTTSFTALLFAAVALLFAVPEEIQGGILDTIITALAGLFVIGVHRWYKTAPLELAVVAALLAIALAVAWRRHQKQVVAEDEARAKAAAVSLRRKAFPTADADEDGASADGAEQGVEKLPRLSSGLSVKSNVGFWYVEEVAENEIL